MGALEHAASRERRLRRAVADLSELAIEDIEAIWNELSPDERAQLRPLLADASRITSGNFAGAGMPDTVAAAEAAGHDDNSAAHAQHIARLGETLPNELLSRLAFCVDASTRDAVLAALPPERRALLVPRGHVYEITERARAALLAAGLAASARSSESCEPAGDALPVRPPRLRQKIRRWLGRSA
ncbi:hypothetical protein BTH42_14930 [Burkholderia sp. SRS-W-2-2016]|uniref:hypothetical protein n=1 Tax=Burkholderia sp. SRS-W-2-2016 TaxID=1926878 RepID=UPI00094B2842|nr:hypothetical protein [Burkholderia sp. SRS-W-2-2016]OLL30866.1 hypothetical protein BTH42_14930 [Burkholderia sp. SRS-W-2-2016]